MQNELKNSPNDALQRLREGNGRFTQGVRSIDSIITPQRMRELAENGQKPFAIVLTCSDSRVPVEMVFDQGMGDLFVVRVAGNVVAPSLIASMEFAATGFGTTLIVVMGHTKCGAMDAAIKCELGEMKPPSDNLARLVEMIQPSVKKCAGHGAGDRQKLIGEVTRENVRNSVREILEKSPILAGLKADNRLEVVGALYDLASGKVEFDPGSAEK